MDWSDYYFWYLISLSNGNASIYIVDKFEFDEALELKVKEESSVKEDAIWKNL